jgi:anti-sigma B factor antagonist
MICSTLYAITVAQGRHANAGGILMNPAAFDTHMELDTEGHAVVYVEGEIDLVTSPALREALAGAVEESASVIVDMGGVHFVDSSGLSALVWGQRGAQQAGGSLRIRRPSAMLRRMLHRTALDSLLLIDDGASLPPPGAEI